MIIHNIESLAHPGVEVYSSLTDTRMRDCSEKERGIFIAESPKVIKRALAAGIKPISLLCERKHIEGDAAEVISIIDSIDPSLPLFTGERGVLQNLTGYKLTRGVLCAMVRPEPIDASELLSGARRVAVLEEISDAVNIGAIIRSAAALDIDAVIIDSGSCHPLNRRAVRVSMGNVFLIPWLVCDNPVSLLHEHGFKCAALALRDDNVSVGDPVLREEPRLAIVLGNEGDGLRRETIERCDYCVKIPMRPGVDSLNVAAAAAVAFWQLS